MTSMIRDIVKWVIIVLMTAAVFYAVMPKYEIFRGYYALNKVTGIARPIKIIRPDGVKR